MNCVCLLIMKLSDLYKSKEMRRVVIKALDNEFEVIFKRLLKNIANSKPYLCVPARYSKPRIRDLFINEGYKLDCIEDLELLLDMLQIWKIDEFTQAKDNYLNSLNGGDT